jgi:D-alanyl-D-alanine carboxypeptidase (penicillin-binding protein 5/6)
MKKLFLAFALATAVLLPAVAQQVAPPQEVAARSYLLLDVTANQLLAAKDIDTQTEPASLTKLMTAYLVFDALRVGKLQLTQELPVSQRAWRMPGSRMFLDPKMKVPVEDLIKGMLVQSGNDAAVALAEGMAGSVEKFVELMNEQAAALGMKSSAFRNPVGLTQAGHYSTARDLGVLATRLMRDFPEYAAYFSIKKYHYKGTPPANDSNRNLLLFRDPAVDGLKTGRTDAAGYCLIASARRDYPNISSGRSAGAGASGGRRLLVVVLGASSENARVNEAQKLLNWGFTAFEPVTLFEANQDVVTAPVWKGSSAVVRLGRPQAIVVAVPSGSAARIKTQVLRVDPLVAPFSKGQPLATLRVSLDERAFTDVPLLVLEAVDEAGLLGRAWDAFKLWIK